ncbi:hypothetical protein Rleg2_4154 [Rhizobium leguminosarum bv. trifolii WSM2304]|uniref:Transmembrane protein n=1 Tax=Rhizobium leguminosarum bv. trifolii (strain WSM2304) TaxID=395492 RepID=A0ABF7QTA8_RHILW|nr:DUF6804 family protein [Rhizobium leguminosarum]ACI57416.1 hypothetical protein Rleg2_4154 [Rhizobium leguminosarum bv. trifolii WSM2304]
MKNNLLLVPVGALLLAVLPLPYGYYILLRSLIAGFSLYLAYRYSGNASKLTGWALAYLFIAVLWNPITPIFLDRGSWFVLDLVVAGIFWYAWHDSARLSAVATKEGPKADGSR